MLGAEATDLETLGFGQRSVISVRGRDRFIAPHQRAFAVAAEIRRCHRLEYRHFWSIALVVVALFAGAASVAPAEAQTCTVSGSAVTLSSGSCSIIPNTTLNGSPGVHASTSAQITTNNVTINPFNGGSIGGLAETSGIIAFSSGSIIEGNYATAASAQTGGQIIFNPGSVINAGTSGGETALLANGVGTGGQPSQIIATGLTVNVNGFGGEVGAKASGGGSILLNQGTMIQFAAGGGGNTGIWATGTGSQIVATGTTLNMPGGGGGDTGVRADTGGAVTLNGGSVSVLGNGGGETGLLAQSAGSRITTSGTVVNVSGGGGDAGASATNGGSITTTSGSVSVVNGEGGLLQNGGSLTMTGTDVTASGNGGNGFLFNNGGSANTLQYNGGTVTASAASFSVQGATANISLSNAIAVTNNNILLETTSSGTTMFNAQGSMLQGVISTQGGSTSTVNLTQGTVWTMTGDSTATNLTNSASSINMIPPTASNSYKTLTVNNYTGAGGNIVLNTYLGTDPSPSDHLVINGGTATGTTALTIHNTTGPGEQTTANGIAEVTAINGATTAAGAFSLAGEVRAGAYDYYLLRGGINGSDPNNWYLRSTFIVPPGAVEPEPIPPTEPDEVLPPDTPALPGGTPPPGLYPIIGPEVATYGVVQPTARQLGLATLGTLNQRIGDTMTLANAGTDDEGWSRSGWARFFGQQVNDRYQAFADPGTEGWLGGFQGGIDLWRGESFPGHRDAAGIYFAYGHANMDVSGLVTNPAATGYMLTHTGTVNLNAFSSGAYWTHYGPSGWYFDAVLQGSLYNSHAATQYAQLDPTGYGFIASLEAGYPIALPFFGPHFVLEPQAQIIWQQVGFGSANDTFGQVDLGTTSGATGRLGVRGQWTIAGANGAVWQPYVGVNFWRDWNGEATTVYSGIAQVPLLEQATRTETFAGVTAKLNSRLSLYAQGGYQFAMEQTFYGIRRDGAQGDIGLRYNW